MAFSALDLLVGRATVEAPRLRSEVDEAIVLADSPSPQADGVRFMSGADWVCDL